MDNGIDYINRTYGTAYRIGCRVSYTGSRSGEKLGTVTGVSGAHLRVRMDDERNDAPYHPTWCMSIVEVAR
jgi:hypothetical protein